MINYHFVLPSFPRSFPSNFPNPDLNHMSYLVGALAHGVNQFLDDHVHALDTGPLQLYDLLLHNSLKRHVWGEKPSPETHQEEKKKETVVMKSGFPF